VGNGPSRGPIKGGKARLSWERDNTGGVRNSEKLTEAGMVGKNAGERGTGVSGVALCIKNRKFGQGGVSAEGGSSRRRGRPMT